MSNYKLKDNFIFFLEEIHKCDKMLYLYIFFSVIPYVLSEFLGALLPATIVEGLQNKWNVSMLVLAVLIMSLVMLIINVAYRSCMVYIDRNSIVFSKYLGSKCMQKSMELDYDYLESADIQKLMGNTWNAFQGADISQAVPNLSNLLLNTTGVLFYGIIIAKKNIYIVIVLMISISVSLYFLNCVRKIHERYHRELSEYTKKINYISRKTMDLGPGKDIRIYNMADWIIKKQEEAVAEMDNIYSHIHNWYFLRSATDTLFAFIKDGVAWGYLIYLYSVGYLSASEFILYIGLINGFSVYFEKLLRALLKIAPSNTSINYVHEFLSLDSTSKVDNVALSEVAPCIELHNVSFKYPLSDKYILKDINLTIKSGEKLAIIGLNGAGKTTLIKLISNLYKPTEGIITYNGVDISNIPRKEYYKKISVLFQDNIIWPMTLYENIMPSIESNNINSKNKLLFKKAVKEADFYEKYNSLDNKGNELLIKEVNPDAIDFSGGEKQRMLFAKTLFKNAPFIILDEPTSALDPIAEEQMYLNLAKSCHNKTTIFISHRLSSTGFCNRIILLENGKIIEEGTHKTLIEQNGRYRELYDRQSKYYMEQKRNIDMAEAFGEIYIGESCIMGDA